MLQDKKSIKIKAETYLLITLYRHKLKTYNLSILKEIILILRAIFPRLHYHLERWNKISLLNWDKNKKSLSLIQVWVNKEVYQILEKTEIFQMIR